VLEILINAEDFGHARPVYNLSAVVYVRLVHNLRVQSECATVQSGHVIQVRTIQAHLA
jgi:hypothetical protein